MRHDPSIEFHDSHLERCERVGRDLVLTLAAYVHRAPAAGGTRGSGWSQPVRLTIRDGEGQASPMTLHEGTLSVEGRRYENMVALPFTAEGHTVLELQGVAGEVATFSGSGVNIEAAGGASFIEELPWDWGAD